MRKVYNWRVVEGDPNEVEEGEILIVRDKNNPNRLDSIQQRIGGQLVDIVNHPECPECPEPEEP